jgi:transcription-repair coupling factor (superfamily II helicase)
MSLLITDDFVTSITERLSLYKELDNIEEEVELQRFRLRLIDRFGMVPPQTEELINAIRLRWMGREIGFEKILLKNEKMTGYFVSNRESPYYRSEKFTWVLNFIQQNPFDRVKKVEDAIKILREIIG